MNNNKNLRVLHAAGLLRPSSGMCTQMSWELEASEELGIEWQVKMYCPKNTAGNFKVLHFDDEIDANNLNNPLSKLWGWLRLRYKYHKWLFEQEDKIDIFLLRYYVHDPFQYWFAKHCKKPIYFVHHTLEVPELELSGGISGWIRSSLESLIGKRVIRLAKGVIGVTQEIVDYELTRANITKNDSYVYPNGIIYKDQILKDRRGPIPEFLFVANFSPWHGLDRLLNEVEKSDENFILHLVGKIPDELKSKTTDLRVKVHGHLNQEQIIELSEQCWIGLASFALDRNNMKEACPLKAREYLMLGLPVYGDYKDIFNIDFIFYEKNTANIKNIIEFSHKTRHFTKKYISQHSAPSICKNILLLKLHRYLTRARKLKS